MKCEKRNFVNAGRYGEIISEQNLNSSSIKERKKIKSDEYVDLVELPELKHPICYK
jgi:hypothetical protein